MNIEYDKIKQDGGHAAQAGAVHGHCLPQQDRQAHSPGQLFKLSPEY
jgi:hypothetical protein